MSTVLDKINALRQVPIGSTPVRFIELLGGAIIDYLNYEPDPITYRRDYYYNTRDNILYKRKWNVRKPAEGIMIAHWKVVSI